MRFVWLFSFDCRVSLRIKTSLDTLSTDLSEEVVLSGRERSMEKWLQNARRIDMIDVEISFLLKREFEEERVEPLPSLAIPRSDPSMVRTSEIETNVKELSHYYSAVVHWAQQHNVAFNRIRQYFWMRLSLWNSKECVSFGFPWYDTLREMEQFFDALESTNEGEVFNDVDQGWELIAFREEDDLILFQRDNENPDDIETQVLARVSQEILLRQVRRLRERTGRIIEQLTATIGHDCWTRYTDWPELNSSSIPPSDVPFPGKKRTWWQKLWWPR